MAGLSSHNYLITINGPDQVGLIAAVTGYLFESGANLADTNFAVLGDGFEFSSLAEFPSDVTVSEVQVALDSLPLLQYSKVVVAAFPFASEGGPAADVTHWVEVRGGDQPGLIARLSDVFVDHGANIVRMSAVRSPGPEGEADYRTRFSVRIPEGRRRACENAIYNTAGRLNLRCEFRPV